MLPRTPRLCRTRGLKAPPPAPAPCLHSLLASSHPHKAKPGRGRSLASGGPPPELLFSQTRGEPPSHSHSSACILGAPKSSAHEQCFPPQTSGSLVCMEWSYPGGLQRPIPPSWQNHRLSGAGPAGPGLEALDSGCSLQGSRAVPWAGRAGCSEPFPRPQPACPPGIAVSRLDLCSLLCGAGLVWDRAGPAHCAPRGSSFLRPLRRCEARIIPNILRATRQAAQTCIQVLLAVVVPRKGNIYGQPETAPGTLRPLLRAGCCGSDGGDPWGPVTASEPCVGPPIGGCTPPHANQCRQDIFLL